MAENLPYKKIEISNRIFTSMQASTVSDQAANQSGKDVIMNWANTRVLANKQQILYPESVEQVSDFVKTHKFIRPVGSRLTYEALTVSNSSSESVLIDVSKLRGLVSIDVANNKAEFWASTTIDEISNTLRNYGKYLDCSPGVIGIQTIAGASGTGTHGQGLFANALCDAIIGGQMVVGDGSLVRVKETDTDLIQAFRTHLGVLGIIVSVELRLQDIQILSCRKTTIPVQEFQELYIDMQAKYEFCKAWWFPNTDLVHIWYATEASKDEEQLYRQGASELYEQNRIIEFDALGNTISEMESRLEQDTLDSERGGRQFETVSRFRNAVTVIGSLQQIFMKGIPVPQINCEIAIPLKDFNAACNELKKWATTTNHVMHYPFIFRCTKKSTALLAPHRDEDVCWIGFLVYLRADGTAKPGSFEMMRELQILLSKFGGTPHWGKHLSPELYNFPKLYPELGKFKAIMKNFDPSGKFQNQWTRDLFSSDIAKARL